MEYFFKKVSYDKKASKEYSCKVKRREDYGEKVGKGHKVEDKSFLWMLRPHPHAVCMDRGDVEDREG